MLQRLGILVRRRIGRAPLFTPGGFALGRLCLVLALGLVAACERGDAVTVTTTPNGSRLELPAGVDPVAFEAGTAHVQSGDRRHTLRVEIAETEAQRARGLMYRTSMPEDAGMLFVYPETTEGGFWMYNTLIPLSIAYADSAGVIVQITEMEPCGSEFASLCPTYFSRYPFQYALEANRGYFARRGVQPGARISFERE